MNRQQMRIVNKLQSQGIDIDALLRQATSIPSVKLPGWQMRGTRIPDGTMVRAWFKDQPYWGKIVGGKFIMADGKTFDTPSAAASAITKRPTNGWDMFEIRTPGSNHWRRMNTLNRQERARRTH